MLACGKFAGSVGYFPNNVSQTLISLSGVSGCSEMPSRVASPVLACDDFVTWYSVAFLVSTLSAVVDEVEDVDADVP